MRNSIQNLNYAWRQLRQSPAFALVAILTLALGIGANTAIFSVTNAILLRYLPVPNPQQVVYLLGAHRPGNTSQTGDDDFSFTEYTFEHLRNQHQSFSDIVAFVPLGLPTIPVRYGEEAEEARADMVSGNFFSGLGVSLELGRGFTLQDETQHAQVAVLSYDYWTRRFGRNPSILGQTLYVKGVPFSVIGVTRRGFAGVEPVDRKLMDVWIPLQNRPDLTAWGAADQHDGFILYGTKAWWCLMMIGRLKPGVTEKQAAAQMTPLFRNTAYWGGAKRDPKAPLPEIQLRPARGNQSLKQAYEQPVELLMAMVGVILLIACSNVAMLLMARNTAREREFSLRMAIGASSSHLFRQLLTESLLLVASGAVLGWLFAQWATRALAAWSRFDLSISPDQTVLLFTLGVSLLAALIFGLAPLRNAVSVSPGLALKSAAAATTQDRHKHRLGRIVVALQMSLCMALLVGAGLLLHSLRNLETSNLGLQPSGLLVFGVTPPQSLHTDTEVLHFFRALTERLGSLPGVQSVTLMENRIGAGWSNNTHGYVDGVLPAGDNDQSAMRWNAVGAGYFSVLHIPLLLGRDLTDADSPTSPKVVVVNHTFAERFLAGRNPIGHHVAFDGAQDPSSKIQPAQYTIVGVAADSRYHSVDEEARPMAYFPYGQMAGIEGVATMHFEVRTPGNPMALLPQVRSLVREFGPDLPLLDPMTQQEQFESSFSQQRLMGRMSIFFAFLAAVLVATGLYGTMAYRVSRRTAEIGVRMALGAQRQQVLWMVLRESLMLGAAGLALGLPLAIAGARLLRSTLFGLGPNDPLSFGAALAGIVVVTLLASLIPARRAASVDPMLALRME
ncbi:MAG TPA: ABC transporter permease, partial [Terriglobia bacterium]|nr:ABC transporter permease [Terriglobia bacterium]